MSVRTTQAIPAYELLTVDTVPAYVRTRADLAALVDVSTLAVREIGDGNLNLVFIARDAAGRGLCLKQSLPYVRLVGESWPLTPHRATAEARSFDAAVACAPELVPTWHGFDRARFVLAMEDLSDWSVWRTALNRGEIHRGVAGQMGDYVARMCFSTSMFGRPIEEVQLAAAEAVNPELCRITEDLVFSEPYIDHEHNSVAPGVEPEVRRLREDAELVAEVGGLKVRFVTCAQALVHGDLHTGSVMVRHVDARDGGSPAPGDDGRVAMPGGAAMPGGGAGPGRDRAEAARGKAIDGEFCYYGPVGFDLGALIGNYLIAMARARVLGRPERFGRWLRTLPAETWAAFEAGIRSRWPGRADPFLSDAFLDDWLAEVWRDVVGFGGCKAIRRIVGLAKVSDIQSLPPDEHVAAATMVLRAAHRWIVERATLRTPADLLRVADEVAAEVAGGAAGPTDTTAGPRATQVTR